MSQLSDFTLSFVRQHGGLVEPTAPDLYEMVLPDALAAAWAIEPFQYVAFSQDAAQLAETELAAENILQLGFSHPMLDEMVEIARRRPTPTHSVIDRVRLAKTGLGELACDAWLLPNARVAELPRTQAVGVRNSYLNFDFKVALISDDKHERLASVMIDAQAGYPLDVAEAARIMQAARPYVADAFDYGHLPPGPLRWRTPAGDVPSAPLSRAALDLLLARAQQAVRHALADTLAMMQQRSRRFRELDEARLNEYYDETAADLNSRLRNAAPERRDSLLAKLSAVAVERQQKLNDAATRYNVRIDLSLINVMLIEQPKLAQPVTLTNRQTTLTTHAVWDPLLHRLEPLGCHVCGRAGARLYLCHNGHVAHAECLAPQCIDCKRVFCAHCAGDVGACDVCHAPLCVHSRIACGECGRYTCREHQGMCHADAGQPVNRGAPAVSAPPPAPTPAAPTPPAPPPKPAARRPARPAAPPAPPPRAAPQPDWPKGVPKPQRMEVDVTERAVVAIVLASRNREVAMRRWMLDLEYGISVLCKCEKGSACQAESYIHRPMSGAQLVAQLEEKIEQMRAEYGIPKKKVTTNRLQFANMPPEPTPRLELFGYWQDEAYLTRCRQGFDREVSRQKRG